MAPRGLSVATLTLLLTTGLGSVPQNPDPVQTVCVLDFHRLGNDDRSDWLEQGLADMLIDTMRSSSYFLVLERKYLKEIIKEHALAQTGLIDSATAVRQAQLAKAQMLLLGSFARQGDELTIQVRLIRVSDQQVLTQVAWTDHFSNVLAAPRGLSERLLSGLGRPIDSRRLQGLENRIPRTIDAAKAYYSGVRAFDAGQYAEALAHYLDAATPSLDVQKAGPGVLEMYYLLGRSEHAVLFARARARSREEKGDVPGALEYYFAAAAECLDPLRDPASASELLRQLLRLADQHERRTGEIARTKRGILTRVNHLLGAGADKDPARILADREIRQQVWIGDIESELERRAEEQARGGYSVLENGKWVTRAVPRPTVLMWQIRARHTLAHAYARSGRIEPALDQYRALLDEYEFLATLPLGRLLESAKTEAHFMMLRHYADTGRLIRDHAMNRINRLNVVRNGLVFTRDFGSPSPGRGTAGTGDPGAPDARARVASRGQGQGHEYFDFAASNGYQIRSVTLRADVRGIAEFGFSLPHPTGWPPQYSFSKRFENHKFSTAGVYERTLVLPPGTEFVSIGTSWGPGLYSNTLIEVARRTLASVNGPDLARWELSFVVAPKAAETRAGPRGAEPLPDPAIRALLDRHAAGWDRGYVVRDAEQRAYSGTPRLDVFAEQWLVYAMDGDIRIFHQRDPRLGVGLPVTINSREREFDPSLVRTHDGRFVLLWARGTSKRNASRFMATSADLLTWEMPQRLVFAEPPADLGYTYAMSEPLERTYNVVPVQRGYVMLLAQGFVRVSADLRQWGPPRKALPQDLDRNRLLKGRDGTVWAVYENSSPELQPYTEDDRLHGFFVTGGKRYRHVTELRVSHSVDGADWKAAGTIVVPGQPNALWAFAVGDRQIGIAASFNNLFVKWFTATPVRNLEPLEPIGAPLQLLNQTAEAEFFVRDGSLTCVRPIFDFDAQKPMLFATSTTRLWRDARTP